MFQYVHSARKISTVAATHSRGVYITKEKHGEVMFRREEFCQQGAGSIV